MRTLTLDTACVIHAVQEQAHANSVDELVTASRAGLVQLFLTAAFDADMSRASAENLSANLRWLQDRPIIQGVQGPFRLEYSTLGGPDVLASGAHAAPITTIEDIVLPKKYRPGQVRADDPAFMTRWARKMNDVQHLAAHLIAGHDAFVTSDQDDIIKKREHLQTAAGITVLTPAEACMALRPSADQTQE